MLALLIILQAIFREKNHNPNHIYMYTVISGGSRPSSRRGRFFGRMNFKGDF